MEVPNVKIHLVLLLVYVQMVTLSMEIFKFVSNLLLDVVGQAVLLDVTLGDLLLDLTVNVQKDIRYLLTPMVLTYTYKKSAMEIVVL